MALQTREPAKGCRRGDGEDLLASPAQQFELFAA
jgi:hypothetical protein